MLMPSALDRVGTLSVLAFGRLDRQTHLLAKRAADEAPNAVGLPFGRGHQFLEGGSARALEQFEDLRGLASRAGGRLFRFRCLSGPLGFLTAFGRFL